MPQVTATIYIVIPSVDTFVSQLYVLSLGSLSLICKWRRERLERLRKHRDFRQIRQVVSGGDSCWAWGLTPVFGATAAPSPRGMATVSRRGDGEPGRTVTTFSQTRGLSVSLWLACLTGVWVEPQNLLQPTNGAAQMGGVFPLKTELISSQAQQ